MRTHLLSVLHAVVALNAVGGGIYGLTGAAGVPVEWLEHTPFPSYLIPSLILLLVVGGTQVAASLSVAARTPRARRVSLAAGAILLGWIGTQVALIGYVSWLQPAVALAAFANLTLAWWLPDDRRVTV
jgi:hypothetical protein